MIIKTDDGCVLDTDEIAAVGKLRKSGSYDVILKSGLQLEFFDQLSDDNEDVIINRSILIKKWLDTRVPTCNMGYFLS